MSQITVASTTDPKEEVYRVAGAKPPAEMDPVIATGDPEAAAAGGKDEPPEPPKTAADSESASENQEETEQSDKQGVNRLQKRFDKLTRTIHEEREARQRAEEKLERLLARFEGKEVAADEQPAQPPAKPTPEQFSTYEDYVDALTDWKTDRKLAEADEKRRQADAEKSQQEAYSKALANYNERLNDARERYDDFDEVLGSAEVEIPDYVQQAIVRAEYGPDIAYYLAKNPKELQQIVNADPFSSVRQIGRIEAALIDREGEGSAATVITQNRPGPTPRPRSLAPTKPVGGTVKATVPPEEMSYSEYRKWRDKQEKDRYRR